MSRIGDIEMENGKEPEAPRARPRYAPQPESAAKIADALCTNVKKVSEVAAAEMEKAADELMVLATDVATKVRAVAAAIRHHSTIAADQMNDFCNRATTVYQGALDLQAQLRGETVAAEQEESSDDGAPPPSFLTARREEGA